MRVPGLDARRAAAVVRWLAARGSTRSVLNSLYRSRSWHQKERLHSRFAKIFREYEGPFAAGVWDVDFGGRPVRVPLQPARAWLMWDLALSVVGHEPEIKQTYETIIRLKPRLVLDVGANYGTHSLLFLVHGVRTISFEPNPNCHACIKDLCSANGVTPTLEPVAVGASEGSIDLWFPESHEWLGTTDPGTRDRLQAQTKLSSLTVPLITVDGYVDAHSLTPDVIKIDTEGSDLQVLLGAQRTVERFRPLILFESWQAQREPIATYFNAQRYGICALPLTSAKPRVLPATEFASTEVANFVAVPKEKLESWPHRT
jgi:FkbM family methyltransferase